MAKDSFHWWNVKHAPLLFDISKWYRTFLKSSYFVAASSSIITLLIHDATLIIDKIKMHLWQAFTTLRIVADLIRRLNVETAHYVHVRVQVISLTVLLTLIASRYYTRVRIYKVKYVILLYIAFFWRMVAYYWRKEKIKNAFWSLQRKIESCDILWYQL